MEGERAPERAADWERERERESGERLLLCSALALLLSTVVINMLDAHRMASPLVDVADREPVCCCLRPRLNK